MGDRTRAKHLKKVNPILVPDSATTIAYGVEPFAMTNAAWGVLAAAACVLAVGLLAGVVIFHVMIFAVLFFQQARPQRIVAVTDYQIVVLSRGAADASPGDIVAAVPRFPVPAHASEITVGTTTVKLDQKEMDIVAAASIALPSHVPAAPSHPFVVPALT